MYISKNYCNDKRSLPRAHILYTIIEDVKKTTG
jgi:hypothetical protein